MICNRIDLSDIVFKIIDLEKHVENEKTRIAEISKESLKSTKRFKDYICQSEMDKQNQTKLQSTIDKLTIKLKR